MKPYQPKDLIKLLRSNGFTLKRIRGSHHVFYHEINNRTVVVPVHKKDLPMGTCLSILKQAGLDKRNL